MVAEDGVPIRPLDVRCAGVPVRARFDDVFAPLGPPATEEWAPPAEPSEAEQRMLLERFPPELDSETDMLETRIAEAENALDGA